MRILYCIGGEGKGHVMRSVAVIEHLRKRHDITVCTSNSAVQVMRKRKIPVHNILHIPLTYSKGNLNYLRSIGAIFSGVLPNWWGTMGKMARIVDTFQPEVIITDYEVFGSSIGLLTGVPVLAADNISVIAKGNVDTGGSELYKLWPLIVDATATIHASWYVIPTFFNVKKSRNNVTFTPPPVRKEVRSLKPTTGNHILVYQTSKTNKQLLRTLKKTNHKYIVYGYEKSGKEKNLTFKRFNERTFYAELASAKAVITGGGFNIITEAIYLGKKIMSVPLKKHYEQCMNGYYVEKMGYGVMHTTPTPEDIDEFLQMKIKKTSWNPDVFAKEVEKRIKKLKKKPHQERIEWVKKFF